MLPDAVESSRLHRALRVALYALVGASLAIILGWLVSRATGLACSCWLTNPVVALKAGAVGGAFFAFIYDPALFRPPR